MHFPEAMMHDTIWFDQLKYQNERENYQMFLTNNLSQHLAETHAPATTTHAPVTTATASKSTASTSALSQEISQARNNILKSLGESTPSKTHYVEELESENMAMKKIIEELTLRMSALECRVILLESGKPVEAQPVSAEPPKKEEESDDDLFSEDDEEETEEEIRIREERVAAYTAKKATKKQVIAKSSLLLDVKPWDDETDMKALEDCVRTIVADGLLWGASKLVEVGYGIKKLQINAVIVDDKISTDWLEEEITKFEDHIQSMDIAAFNKI